MTPGENEPENDLNISTGQPELGMPTLTINPPAEQPAKEQPKGDEDAAGPAEDQD